METIEMPTADDPVTVIQGDCLEVLRRLPDGCVDAVVTDPPYGLGEAWNGGGGAGGSSWSFDPSQAKAWDMEPATEAVELLPGFRVPSVVWGGNNYRLPPSRCWFVWDKKVNDNFTTGQAELAWTNIDRPTRVFRQSQVEAHTEMGRKVHPTQKPLSLMRWCIRMMRLPEGAVILDPFAGSGTTGVAAMLEGRRAILIEREPAYCDIIRRRLDHASGTGAGSLFAGRA